MALPLSATNTPDPTISPAVSTPRPTAVASQMVAYPPSLDGGRQLTFSSPCPSFSDRDTTCLVRLKRRPVR